RPPAGAHRDRGAAPRLLRSPSRARARVRHRVERRGSEAPEARHGGSSRGLDRGPVLRRAGRGQGHEARARGPGAREGDVMKRKEPDTGSPPAEISFEQMMSVSRRSSHGSSGETFRSRNRYRPTKRGPSWRSSARRSWPRRRSESSGSPRRGPLPPRRAGATSTRRSVGRTSSLFERYLDRTRRRIDRALDARLPSARDEPRPLHAAIRYSVFAGGKRLRPALCLLACESVMGRSAPAIPAAVALEMIHTFSLIHDDLPGMDDDDWRRGRPSNHVVFGEGMAILAGDALLALGFQTLASSPLGRARDPRALIRIVTEATGTGGMIGGQAMDLLSEGKRLPLKRVLAMHARKTAMLIRGSLLL